MHLKQAFSYGSPTSNVFLLHIEKLSIKLCHTPIFDLRSHIIFSLFMLCITNKNPKSVLIYLNLLLLVTLLKIQKYVKLGKFLFYLKIIQKYVEYLFLV